MFFQRAGELVALSFGDTQHEDYQIFGYYVVLKPVDPSVLKQLVDDLNSKQNASRDNMVKEFASLLVAEGYLVPISVTEIHVALHARLDLSYTY